LTQFINVAGRTFNLGASRSTAADRDSSAPISSNTNRTACSLNSTVYSLRTGIS
jgi:hypothetical protein